MMELVYDDLLIFGDGQIIGGRLFMIQPFSTERFEREKKFPRSKRFWETIKFALVP